MREFKHDRCVESDLHDERPAHVICLHHKQGKPEEGVTPGDCGTDTPR